MEVSGVGVGGRVQALSLVNPKNDALPCRFLYVIGSQINFLNVYMGNYLKPDHSTLSPTAHMMPHFATATLMNYDMSG